MKWIILLIEHGQHEVKCKHKLVNLLIGISVFYVGETCLTIWVIVG